jgi:hypothetical protein
MVELAIFPSICAPFGQKGKIARKYLNTVIAGVRDDDIFFSVN